MWGEREIRQADSLSPPRVKKGVNREMASLAFFPSLDGTGGSGEADVSAGGS
jgi:hypothetical protein